MDDFRRTVCPIDLIAQRRDGDSARQDLHDREDSFVDEGGQRNRIRRSKSIAIVKE
jgi:hypothetical protein